MAPTAPFVAGQRTRLSERVLSLPMHPYLNDTSAERICAAVRAASGG